MSSWDHMCKGPDEKMQEYHKEVIAYHEMMIKFYSMSRPRQLAFMALFECLIEENQEKPR